MIYKIIKTLAEHVKDYKISDKNVVLTTQHLNIFPYFLIDFDKMQKNIYGENVDFFITCYSNSSNLKELEDMINIIYTMIYNVNDKYTKNKNNFEKFTINNVKHTHEKGVKIVIFSLNYKYYT